MPTRAEISRNLGVSRAYVTQLCKRGMPTDSFENARDWKKAHASKRASTNPIQIAKQLAEEQDDDSPAARARRKTYFENKPDGVRIPAENSLDDALAKAIGASDEAFRLLSESMIEEKDSKISSRLSIHNKALDARFRAEQSHREELERRRILIPLAEAEDWTRKAFDVILSRLSALPQNLAVRCNPSNPHTAMDALQEECTAIVADAQKVFA
jgi:hypothetical protein